MRNLKKILALVLAMIMAFSVMATANAALTDLDSVDASYDEAVEVLTGLGVFEGRVAADGSTYFAPKGTITRQEVAAILYRIDTGRVGDNAAMFVEGADFTDVKATDWAAGYIGYCANGGLVNGYGNGKFGPTDNITGYQVLAMILRAVGYDANGEFSGADWQKNVASYAQQLGILNSLNEDVVLSQPATREVVAEILFQAIQIAQVEYTPAFNYQPTLITGKPQSIGEEVFGLKKVTTDAIDDWGRPGYFWYANNKKVATIEEIPAATHITATTDCVVAMEMGLKSGLHNVDMWVNGVKGARQISIAQDYDVMGGQGVQVEVYKDRIVRIDTYLAKVGTAHPATYDKGGHVMTKAFTDVEIYINANGTATTTYTLDGVGYNYGEYILVNVNVGKSYIVSLGAAETLVGAQTIIWQNAAKHTVAGTTYDDAETFYLDAAGNTASAQFTWFFDQFGNLIGDVAIQTVYSYATIKDIQWYNPASAFGYAQATLVYVDGTTENVVVNKIDGKTLKYSMFEGDPAEGGVSANYGYNSKYIGEKLYALTKNASGVATLTTVANPVEGATVTTKNPVITNGKAYTYVDDSTQFLVRSGAGAYAYTWTTVAGYNAMPTLQNATVYYVNLDADLAAEYAYIYGATSAALTPNLVYVNSLAFAYETFDGEGNPTTVTLKDAYVGGVLTDVVVSFGCVNGEGNDLVAGHLYYMADANADGWYNIYECTDLINADGVAIGNLTAKYVAAGDYSILNNALQVKDINVPFNITGVSAYGNWTGAENIVVIYSGYTVSAIYVVEA